MKQRIMLVGGGLVILLILISLVSSLLSRGGSAGTTNIKRVVARQTELVRVADLAADDGQSAETRALALNISLSLTTDKQKLTEILTDSQIELTPQEAQTYKDTKTDAELETAASDNRYDEAFMGMIAEMLNEYISQLETAHESSAGKAKAAIQTSYDNAVLLRDALK